MEKKGTKKEDRRCSVVVIAVINVNAMANQGENEAYIREKMRERIIDRN